jgi:hypothetical protein
MAHAQENTQPLTTAQRLSSIVKSCRDIMRKDKGLNGEPRFLINYPAASCGYRRPIMRTIPIPSPWKVLVRGPESGLAWIPAYNMRE